LAEEPKVGKYGLCFDTFSFPSFTFELWVSLELDLHIEWVLMDILAFLSDKGHPLGTQEQEQLHISTRT
jgi:hypothetical protein